MDRERQRAEVELNYDVFTRQLSRMLRKHRNQFALMRDGKVVEYFSKPGEANRAGIERFPDFIFSIQEVTDEPIDLGFWSHAASH